MFHLLFLKTQEEMTSLNYLGNFLEKGDSFVYQSIHSLHYQDEIMCMQ